jgi:hypothetical protein
MRGDKAAGIAGLRAPCLQPGLIVLEIGQALLPIGVREGPRIASNRAGIHSATVRFIVIASGVEPARRIWDELPPLLRFGRPDVCKCQRFGKQMAFSDIARGDYLRIGSLCSLPRPLYRIDRIPLRK